MWEIGCSSQGWTAGVYEDEETLVEELYQKDFRCIEVSAAFTHKHIANINPCAIHAYKKISDYDVCIILAYMCKIRKVMKDLHCNMLIVHPPEKLIDDYSFLKYVCKDMVIGIENTSENVFRTVDDMSNIVECGIVFDFSHFYRLKIPLEVYRSYKIIHVHARGFGDSSFYLRINFNSKSDIMLLLQYLKEQNYKGVFMLEYPYNSINDAIVDQRYLRSCLKLLKGNN